MTRLDTFISSGGGVCTLVYTPGHKRATKVTAVWLLFDLTPDWPRQGCVMLCTLRVSAQGWTRVYVLTCVFLRMNACSFGCACLCTWLYLHVRICEFLCVFESVNMFESVSLLVREFLEHEYVCMSLFMWTLRFVCSVCKLVCNLGRVFVYAYVYACEFVCLGVLDPRCVCWVCGIVYLHVWVCMLAMHVQVHNIICGACFVQIKVLSNFF